MTEAPVRVFYDRNGNVVGRSWKSSIPTVTSTPEHTTDLDRAFEEMQQAFMLDRERAAQAAPESICVIPARDRWPADTGTWDIASDSHNANQVEYRRADAPLTPVEAMRLCPEVANLVEAADRLKWQLAGFQADLDDTDAPGMVKDYLGHVVPAALEFENALAAFKGETNG